MKYFLAIIVSLTLIFPACDGRAEESSLQQVLRKTYLENPTLQAARAELKAVHESLPQAQAGWKPNIAASAGVNTADISGSNFGGASGSTEKNIGLSITQPLFRGGSTFAAVNAAQQKILAQRYVLLQSEQDVLSAAVTAYMDVIRDRALMDLSAKNKDVLQKQLEATTERFEVGELTRTDVSQAEARLSRAEADFITASGDLKISRANYERLIGTLPHTDMSAPEIDLDLPDSREDAMARAEEIAPQILRAEFEHTESEKRVDEVYGELLPQIDLSADWSRSYDPQPGTVDESTSRSLGALMTLPLYQSGAVLSRVREAKQNANQQYIEILEARRFVRENIIQAWEELDTSRAEIRAREKQVEAATIAREGVYQEEQVGIRTILDTLDADQELLDAEVSLVIARRNETVSMFNMAAVLGLLTPVYLGFAEDQLDYDAHLRAVKTSIYSLSADPSVDN